MNLSTKKNGIQKEFRHFAKNPNSTKNLSFLSETVHFLTKVTNSDKIDRFFWLNFQQLFCCWIQIFIGVKFSEFSRRPNLQSTFRGLIHKAHSDDLTKIICDKLSEFLNFIWIQTIFPKNGIQKEFRHFAKNPNSQRSCHFCLKLHFQQIKMTNSDKMDQFFLAEFSATILLLNSEDFYWCQIVWIQQTKSKAISDTSASSLWIRLQINPKPFQTLWWVLCELGYRINEIWVYWLHALT